MRKVFRILAIAVGLGLLLSSGAAAASSNLDSQLWDEVGLGGDPVKVRALLDLGADPNIKGSITGTAVLTIAKNVEVARALLDRSANVNAQDNEGKTALYHQVSRGEKEMVELLIARGANTNTKTVDGETPLEVIAHGVWKNSKEIAELLISKGADVNARDKTKRTPLYSAAFEGQKDLVELLIAKGADVNAETSEGVPVLSATCVQDTEIVTMLKSAGAKGTPETCSEEVFLYR